MASWSRSRFSKYSRALSLPSRRNFDRLESCVLITPASVSARCSTVPDHEALASSKAVSIETGLPCAAMNPAMATTVSPSRLILQTSLRSSPSRRRLSAPM